MLCEDQIIALYCIVDDLLKAIIRAALTEGCMRWQSCSLDWFTKSVIVLKPWQWQQKVRYMEICGLHRLHDRR